MEWIAAAIVFCFLMWKWPKKTLIGIAVCIAAGCLIGAGIFGFSKYHDYSVEKEKEDFRANIHIKKVSDDVRKKYKCKHPAHLNDKYHFVSYLKNDNDKRIDSFKINVWLIKKGHSDTFKFETFKYDIYADAHGESIPFCIDFSEDMGIWDGSIDTGHQEIYVREKKLEPYNMEDLEIRVRLETTPDR